MKSVVLNVLLLVVLSFSACMKKDKGCNPLSSQEEKSRLDAYVSSAAIDATYDERGFYYIIEEPGSEGRPNMNSTVNVNYAGFLTDGRSFDASDNASMKLSSLITGWQYGIPLIGTGGKIKLILPPSLAYGCYALDIIESNSILIFEVTLNSFY